MPLQARVSPEFGRQVRALMGELSQSEVALRASISVGYVNRMARGSVPSRAIILRLAEALAADPTALLKSAGYAVNDKNEPVGRLPADDGTLGFQAATQYRRRLWDSYIRPLFPDAEMPSGAEMPLTTHALREWVVDLLRELIEATEAERQQQN